MTSIRIKHDVLHILLSISEMINLQINTTSAITASNYSSILFRGDSDLYNGRDFYVFNVSEIRGDERLRASRIQRTRNNYTRDLVPCQVTGSQAKANQEARAFTSQQSLPGVRNGSGCIS